MTSKSLSPSQQREEEVVCSRIKEPARAHNGCGTSRGLNVTCVCCVNSSLSDLTEGKQKKNFGETNPHVQIWHFPIIFTAAQDPLRLPCFIVFSLSLLVRLFVLLSHTHTNAHAPPPPPWHHSWLPSLWSPPHTPEPPDYHHPTPRETMALSSRLKLWEQKGGAEFRACGSDWASGGITPCLCFAVQPNMDGTIGCALI